MRTTNRGFTLGELMIAVAIVAILAAIVYPSYRDQVIRSNRSDAKIALSQAAQELEKCYTRFNAYNAAACAAAANLAGGIDSPARRYRVTAAISDVDYTLTATRQGPQADDSQCGDYTLTNKGAQGATGSGGVTTCW